MKIETAAKQSESLKNKKAESPIQNKNQSSSLGSAKEAQTTKKTAETKLAEKARASKTQEPLAEEPAYVVSVGMREPTTEEKANMGKGYTPEEVRAKAKAFLNSTNLPPEQREVLAEILKKQEDEANAALKKRVKGS